MKNPIWIGDRRALARRFFDSFSAGPAAPKAWRRRAPKNLELFINRDPEETLEVIDAARGIKVRREPRYVVDSKRWCSIKDVIDTKGDRGICE